MKENTSSKLTGYEANDVIRQFKLDITCGKHWYLALLEAIGRWTTPQETVDGRTYRYLIGGEAFDWLLLAERLCGTVNGLIPEGEKVKLLFYGKAPINMTTGEFETFLGETKYRQYLNFFYGITVEEALLLSVQEEVRKERITAVFHKPYDYEDDIYIRIYGSVKTDLLKEFRRNNNSPQSNSISLTEIREFTYWLFKYRLEHCDRSRVASDTKKAMEFLKEQYTKKLCHEF